MFSNVKIGAFFQQLILLICRIYSIIQSYSQIKAVRLTTINTRFEEFYSIRLRKRVIKVTRGSMLHLATLHDKNFLKIPLLTKKLSKARRLRWGSEQSTKQIVSRGNIIAI